MEDLSYGQLVEALRDAEERFRAAFSYSPVGRGLVSPKGGFIRVNNALCEMFGYDEEELLSMHFTEVAHPDDADVDGPQIQKLWSGELDSYQVEKRFHDRNGNTRWGHLSVSVARDVDSQPRDFMAQVIDITSAKETEASLRKANALLGALFEHSPAWHSLRSLDGRYLDANSKLAEIMGATRDELVGRYPSEFSQTQAIPDLDADDRRVSTTREPVVREMTVSHPGGEPRAYHTVRYPVLDDQGEVTAIGSIGMDITDRQRADTMRDRALEDLNEAQRIAKVGSWSWNAVTDKSEWSDEMFRIHGRRLERGAPSGSESFQYVARREDRRRFAEAFRNLLAGAETFELEYRIVTDDGVEKFVHSLAHADRENPGAFRGVVQDVTAIRATERDIHAVQERFRRAFEDAPVGMSITTPDGQFLQANYALCAMLGYSREDLLAANIQLVTHPDELPQRHRYIDAILRGEIDQYRVEGKLVRADGTAVWGARFTTALRDENGEAHQLLSHVVDITERRRMEEELRHLADHDSLTGLLNRRGLIAQLERHVAYVQRHGDRGALLMLDLDRFKSVNDSRGHEIGDQLLVAIAEMLSRRLRASDSIARLGGDEFAILLPDADVETAEQVAGEIVTEVGDSEIGDGSRFGTQVTASVGVTAFTQAVTTSRAILVDADLAMYHAKEAGRNRVAVHHHTATPL